LQMYAQRAFAGFNNLKPKPVFQFAPQGGLGIFVNSGVAAFRDVVIEPLP